MRSTLRLLLVSCIAATAASAASAGSAQVSFVNAAGFGDAGSTPYKRDANLRDIADHLAALAQRHLPASQVLKVEVTDVDLAGTVRPGVPVGKDLRVLRGGADAPQISLRYTLEDGGRNLRSGAERLPDMNYLRGAGAGATQPPDSLAHEKHLLDTWFKARFIDGRADGG